MGALLHRAALLDGDVGTTSVAVVRPRGCRPENGLHFLCYSRVHCLGNDEKLHSVGDGEGEESQGADGAGGGRVVRPRG